MSLASLTTVTTTNRSPPSTSLHGLSSHVTWSNLRLSGNASDVVSRSPGAFTGTAQRSPMLHPMVSAAAFASLSDG